MFRSPTDRNCSGLIEPSRSPFSHPVHGAAVVRDQKPMDDTGLRRCLQDGLTPTEWYEILNDKTFFWLTEERLLRLLNARPYRRLEHTVLVVDTARLLERHEKNVLLSPINSGCTKPYPAKRGRTTFLPLPEYPFDIWRKKRGRLEAVVELSVAGGVPDVKDFVLEVQVRSSDGISRVICRRPPGQFYDVGFSACPDVPACPQISMSTSHRSRSVAPRKHGTSTFSALFPCYELRKIGPERCELRWTPERAGTRRDPLARRPWRSKRSAGGPLRVPRAVAPGERRSLSKLPKNSAPPAHHAGS